MWRGKLALLCLSLFGISTAHAQLTKQFYVEDGKDFKKVNLDLRVDFGSCEIKSTQRPGIFSVYSTRGAEQFSHNYSKVIKDGVCELSLKLEEHNPGGLGQSISNNLFGEGKKFEESNNWKAYLSTEKTYDLNLEYGVGYANIDLSELAVENLKVHTGSADVKIGYFKDVINKVEMDTFYVKVDLGNVIVKNLAHARSEYVVADVGFGNLSLDLSERSKTKSTVNGKVGAGTLMIFIPGSNAPVKLKIKDSWLTRVSLPDTFEKVSHNEYINDSYYEGAENLLTFNLDVSMGSLIFKEKH